MFGEENLGEGKQQPSPERNQTDESLRVEREKVDAAIGLRVNALEQIADAVIEKARGRADEVMAVARAKADRLNARATARSSGMLARSRAREDAVLRRERSDEDEVLRAERSSQSGYLSALRRDTDDDLFEERSRADDALATRDEFLGIVSHDLRNMLGSVMGWAMLIEKAELRENQAGAIRMSAQRIQRSGARMSRLIGDLVDVASIEADALAVNYEVGDPTALVVEAVDTFQTQAAAAQITLVAEVIPPLTNVPFDPARIFQVLTNLLSNAIKFTPPKGRVVLRVEQVDDALRFGVQDTGVGIAADKLEAVFERFHQLGWNDRRGVGLGLYISKCIVHGHHGRIWVESNVGEGSRFYFTLPIPRTDSSM
jgi:signal transduction histidine kinase